MMMMTIWWHDYLMTWPSDDMTIWWHDHLMTWPSDDMTIWWHDRPIIWHHFLIRTISIFHAGKSLYFWPRCLHLWHCLLHQRPQESHWNGKSKHWRHGSSTAGISWLTVTVSKDLDQVRNSEVEKMSVSIEWSFEIESDLRIEAISRLKGKRRFVYVVYNRTRKYWVETRDAWNGNRGFWDEKDWVLLTRGNSSLAF